MCLDPLDGKQRTCTGKDFKIFTILCEIVKTWVTFFPLQ